MYTLIYNLLRIIGTILYVMVYTSVYLFRGYPNPNRNHVITSEAVEWYYQWKFKFSRVYQYALLRD